MTGKLAKTSQTDALTGENSTLPIVERLRGFAVPWRAHNWTAEADAIEQAADTIEELAEALRSAPVLPLSFDQYDRFASQYRAFREKRTAVLTKIGGDS